jgi:hypothetical protein
MSPVEFEEKAMNPVSEKPAAGHRRELSFRLTPCLYGAKVRRH